MMRYMMLVLVVALGVVLLATPSGAAAQARPNTPAAEKQARGQGQARGQDQARRGPPAHARARRGGPAPDPAAFNRNLPERAVEARLRRNGGARGVNIERTDRELRVTARDGRTLLTLDAARANEIGYWRAARVSDAVERNRRGEEAPAFCRSGEGHPVWGREWCVSKGFGLGGDRVWGWSRPDDVVLRTPRPDRGVLDRESLADILGDIVFGRLALQSLVLGADEPLTGEWLVTRPDSPRILSIRAGDLVVAEVVDRDRDDRVDAILFNLGT